MKNYALIEIPKYENMRDMVDGVCTQYAERNAYSYREGAGNPPMVTVTYAKLHEDVRALATEMRARGYAGKHCVCVGRLSYPWIVTYMATIAAGAVFIPLDRDWTAADLASTVERADTAVVFYDADLGEERAEAVLAVGSVETSYLLSTATDAENTVFSLVEAGKARREAGDRAWEESKIDPDATASIVFTSGTTGKGKGVMLSSRNILSNVHSALSFFTMSMRSMAVLPPHHTFGSTINLLGHLGGGSELYLSRGLRYIQNELKTERPGHMVMVPLYLETFYRKIWANIREQGKEKLVKNMMKLCNVLHLPTPIRRKMFSSILAAFGGRIDFVVTGGAPINSEIANAYETWGVKIINGYGITECAPLVAANRNKIRVQGSVGFPVPCNEVYIAEPNEDGEGEIRVKGENVMQGYYKDPEATAEVFDDKGYFCTGDYGKLDKDGLLYITGRKKNLIILSNGKNVYPEEIEAELSGVPGVLDIIVYEGESRRGPEYNAIVAEIFPDKEYFEKNANEDVKAYFQGFVDQYNRTCTPYKKISILRVRDTEFPKNTLRKIQRFRLDRSID
ncbi:MAG: AMP-binding protein [Clostridia bacterium]|nr:AMP-binding protein [Clostridia bacterium]